MRYLHVKWLHDILDEPVDLYSELDEDSREVRKVEVFADGRTGFARMREFNGATRLGREPLPNLEEIAEDAEFEPEEITGAEFERLWDSARSIVRAR